MTGLVTVRPESWVRQALCRQMIDPNGYYADRRTTSEVAALALCAACPVRQHCLQDALDRDDQFGIWGGTSPAERRQLRVVAA